MALRMHHGADGCGDATNTTNTHGASALCPMVLFSFCSSRSCCCCRIRHGKHDAEATANAKNMKTTIKLTTSPTTSRKSTTIRLFQKPPARDKHMHACIRVYGDATQKRCGFWRNLQNSMSDTCSQTHAAKQRTHRFCKFELAAERPKKKFARFHLPDTSFKHFWQVHACMIVEQTSESVPNEAHFACAVSTWSRVDSN